MSDEPTHEDELEMDAADLEGTDEEVNPRGDVDASESEINENGRDEEPGHQPTPSVDVRGSFLDWFDRHFNTVEVSGDRERAPWCPEWWLHPEVNARLWALYMAWIGVEASESVAALSDWWLNHWDRHRPVLFDGQTGPFRDCDTTRGHMANRMRNIDRKAVPVTLPPDDWQPPTS
jgi:hypothetical protein